MIVNDATKEFIRKHRLDDVRDLALHSNKSSSLVDLPFALDQIAGWQTARKKLPTWASTDGIIYPPHLNMEQCSSERTAKYKKASLSNSLPLAPSKGGGKPSNEPLIPPPLEGARGRLSRGRLLIDLTGGFGVDFSFLSRSFTHAIYVEKNERLCEIAKHNFKALGLNNVEVINDDAEEFLANYKCPKNAENNHKADYKKGEHEGAFTPPPLEGAGERPLVIFLDPARRDANGHKVFGIEDCTPDVLAMKDELLAKADMVMIKLSPMLDWHAAAKAFGPCCKEVHIVSVDNECKELLLILNGKDKGMDNGKDKVKGNGKGNENNSLKVVCVNLLDNDKEQRFEYNVSIEDKQQNYSKSSIPSLEDLASYKYLFAPNASIMKAGYFGYVSSVYGITELGNNSHLFVGKDDIADFPGRKFTIAATSTMNKRELKEKLRGIGQANISVRNFPLSVAELRKRLKIKDGGDTYIFATTVCGKHELIITQKVNQ